MKAAIDEKNLEAFKPKIDEEEWDKMNQTRRQEALEVKAEELRSKISNCLREMANANYSAVNNKIRKTTAQSNEEAEERFLQRKVPDPLKAIPAYLESKSVQDMNVMICVTAEQKRVVSAKELSNITNHLLVRISIKNGLRKQVEPLRTI